MVAVELAELEYLLRMLKDDARPHIRYLVLADIVGRLPHETPADARLALAVRNAGMGLETLDACVMLLERFLENVDRVARRPQVDLLIVCPKSIELTALRVVLGIDLAADPTHVSSEGFHFFEGQLRSRPLDRELSFALVCLGNQTNARTSGEVGHILRERPARLAVLVGMAAGVPEKVEAGDVVMAELVEYVASGSRRDSGFAPEPDPLRINYRLAREFATVALKAHGWHERYIEAVERAAELDLELPPNDAAKREPRLKAGVVLSDEAKDETTSLQERAREFHGDACALEMEGYGFALACESANTPWLIFRGIADFGLAGLRRVAALGEGSEDAKGEEDACSRRPKNWQLAATLAASSAMLVWVTQQLYFFDSDRSPQ